MKKRYFYTAIDSGDVVTVHRCMTKADAENMVEGNKPLAKRIKAISGLCRSAIRLASSTGWPVEIAK